MLPWPLALDIDPTWFPCDGPVGGVPHGWNVLSNLPFVAVGLWGVVHLVRRGRLRDPAMGNWLALWISVTLVGLGSGTYHVVLDRAGLAFDRAAICALTAFLGAHALDRTLGLGPSRRISFALLLLTESTVVLWWFGGTSLVYGGLQAVGGLGVVLLFVRARKTGRVTVPAWPIYAFLALYAAAKVVELLDVPICEALGCVGGHPWKHVLAAIGLALLGRMMVLEEAESASS